MPSKLERIKDDALRDSLTRAKDALRSGDFAEVVHRASNAYVELLNRKPELLQGPTAMRNILFFPRLGARLIQEPDGSPKVIFDREEFIFSEAVTYYEFALDSLVRHEI